MLRDTITGLHRQEERCSAPFARLDCEMTQAFNERLVQPRAGRMRENSTATPIEQAVNGALSAQALDCGFGDRSNFNRAFRAELGLAPRAYRRR